MGYTITEKMLYNTVELIEGQCRKLEFITDNETLSLTIGSKLFGNSFKLQVWNTEERKTKSIFGEYLGMTKKEADLTLCGIKEALSHIIRNV